MWTAGSFDPSQPTHLRYLVSKAHLMAPAFISVDIVNPWSSQYSKCKGHSMMNSHVENWRILNSQSCGQWLVHCTSVYFCLLFGIQTVMFYKMLCTWDLHCTLCQAVRGIALVGAFWLVIAAGVIISNWDCRFHFQICLISGVHLSWRAKVLTLSA